jgi:hypothetical protein
VAEGARLESVYTGNRIVGSNPTLSATPSREWFSPTARVRFSPYFDNEKPGDRAGLFRYRFPRSSMHGVDDQIAAAEQKNRNAHEQKNRHVALLLYRAGKATHWHDCRSSALSVLRCESFEFHAARHKNVMAG